MRRFTIHPFHRFHQTFHHGKSLKNSLVQRMVNTVNSNSQKFSQETQEGVQVIRRLGDLLFTLFTNSNQSVCPQSLRVVKRSVQRVNRVTSRVKS